jgi:hypothetical protein
MKMVRSGWKKSLWVVACLAVVAFSARAQELTITNLVQLGKDPFDGSHSIYTPYWNPWEWKAFWLGGEPAFIDFSRFPELSALQGCTNSDTYHGVPVVSAQLTKFVLTGELLVQSGCSTDILAKIAAPQDYQPWAYAENRGVLMEWQSVTNCPLDCWGIEGDIPPPTVTLRLSLADLNLYPTCQSNIDLEAEAEAEAEATASENARATIAGGTFMAMAEAHTSGGLTMLLGGVDPCSPTNETLAITSITADTNRWITVSWSPTCTNFIYGVFSTDELTEGVWTNRAALWGNPNDTSTSWTDATTANVDHRFYKVIGILPSETSDWDGDGMPDWWEMPPQSLWILNTISLSTL